jgi:AraC-type DNA-binding domain-containing proteins
MDKDTNILNNKRGFLDKEFSFFNLNDEREITIDSHYHDFCKVIVFVSGKVTYYIEGTAYRLKPWDILLVNCDTIHKPVINFTSPYKRMIIWVRPSFLQKNNDTKSNLLTCFELAHQRNLNLLRMTPKMQIIIQSLLSQINDTYQHQNFGNELLRNSLLIQFIIYLNRMTLEVKNGIIPADIDIEHDETVNKILKYIDSNIAEDLSIEKLTSVFFLSKHYLMRKFKQHTGYSIHQYVMQKRLIAANQILRSGQSVITACMESGFHDYANFTRAFKKMYGMSPKNVRPLSTQPNC